MLAHRVMLAGRRAYADEVIADSPAAYWKLDETSGTTASDSSGNGNHGTYGSGVTLNQSPLIVSGKAIVATANSQPAVTGTDIAFSTALGVGLWLKLAAAPGAGRNVFGKYANGAWPVWSFDVLSDGKPRIELFQSNGTGGRLQLVGPASITDNARHQINVSWDKAGDQKVHLYVDGAQVAESAAWNNTLWAGSGHTVRLYQAGSESMAFDEASVYTHALSATRVQAHYNAGA